MSSDDGVRLQVAAAQKRDAGRGVARLPEAARQQLGVLSGDTVVIEGDHESVAKVWPAGPDVPADTVRVDGDTRATAGVSVGDSVAVRSVEVSDAERVTLAPTGSVSADERSAVRRVVKRDLKDRPVSAGERVRIDHLGVKPFVISAVEPAGTVRVTAETSVAVTDEPTDEAPTPGTQTGVTYEDIGGLDEQLEQVRETVELPLAEPELFQRLGVDPPKGVLLFGPPGTGKTLIARAVANEVDATFIDVSGPEIMSKYKGESEERLREVFAEAREASPSVVYFDELDAIASKREDADGAESRVVAQLLSLMDGLETRGEVVVIASTNRADALDPALRRGGRFDREIEVGVPDEAGRREILAVHTRDMPLADTVDLDRLAARTHGFVGADIDALATEAGMAALRRVRPARQETRVTDEDSMTITNADFDAAMAAVEPSAMREYVAETPRVSFEDVGGLENAKQILRETVEWPLAYEPLFTAAATEPPSGILLYGPPGTGKTLLARAVASESDVNFIHVNGPELLDRYVGESEKAVREVFERARRAAPTIVFFDEIDAIAGGRGSGNHEVTERIVSQLLAELDGLVENPTIITLAATNRREAIDEALLRPGRLERHVEVPPPDEAARREILEVHTRGTPLAADVDLDQLAEDLDSYTGADIDALVRAASMQAVRDVAEETDPGEATDRTDEVIVRTEHFAAARAQLE